MDNEEHGDNASVSSAQSSSSYEANKISRRTALKKLGVVVGGISLMGFGIFDAEPKARATLEDVVDPATGSETQHSSLGWIYSSSWCSSCARDAALAGSSYESGFYIDTSSSSWTYWWS